MPELDPAQNSEQTSEISEAPKEASKSTKDDKPRGLKKPIIDLSTPEGRKKLSIISGALIIVLAVVAGAVYASINKDTNGAVNATATPVPTPTPKPTIMASLLDGVMVSSDLATRHPLAVMIENHPDARPQAGLGEASVVYEAITEGGITRFMALFGHTVPEKVGPVRSARSVFIDFAEEYTPNSAYYAHVGGESGALGKISGDKVYDLNQSSIGAKAFQRFAKAGVATEHTMYAFPAKLFQVAKDLGYKTESTFQSWKFKEDTSIENRPEAQTISIPFSSATYDVKYTYDKASNTYKRTMGGTEHKDANTGKVIAPKNVIVHFASYERLPGSTKDVQKVGVLGEGKAKIFLDGKVIDATWKKPSSPSRTIYTDTATGKEVEFNRGQIYVEIPKIGSNVTAQ